MKKIMNNFLFLYLSLNYTDYHQSSDSAATTYGHQLPLIGDNDQCPPSIILSGLVCFNCAGVWYGRSLWSLFQFLFFRVNINSVPRSRATELVRIVHLFPDYIVSPKSPVATAWPLRIREV